MEQQKLNKRYIYFKKIINELNKNEIPSEIVSSVNQDIDKINYSSDSNKKLSKQLRKSQMRILNLVEKEFKLVPKNFYRNRWLAIGISVFGISFGTAFGAILGNMTYVGIGIPIGMVIGIAIGTEMGKKASKNGKQLDFESEY